MAETRVRRGKKTYCGVCREAYEKARPKREPCENRRLAVRKNFAKLRALVIAGYGGRCECCGETEPRFLTIDHIKNNGRVDRERLPASNLLRHLRDAGFPKGGYRLLCFNCNCGRAINGGECPHRTGLGNRER